jgi:hypothetical protein
MSMYVLLWLYYTTTCFDLDRSLPYFTEQVYWSGNKSNFHSVGSSAGTEIILTEIYRNFSQSLHATS